MNMRKEQAQTSNADGEELPGYFVDLEWFVRANRSFPTFARSRMCPMHRGEVEGLSDPGGNLEEHVFNVFGACCSKAEDFISLRLPVREAIFRLFLANGNAPLNTGEIEAHLRAWWREDADSRDLSSKLLTRLLENGSFYGFKRYIPPEGERLQASG